MDIKSNEKDGVLVVEINGEINISTSPELKKWFEKTPSSRILINMSKVGYVDSSGLATLVELLKRTKGKNGSLTLSQMSDKVRGLFEITKLDRLFGIYTDDEAALKNLK